jgi:hypothetical protein
VISESDIYTHRAENHNQERMGERCAEVVPRRPGLRNPHLTRASRALARLVVSSVGLSFMFKGFIMDCRSMSSFWVRRMYVSLVLFVAGGQGG